MMVERISTSKFEENNHMHVFKFKNALLNVRNPRQIDVIKDVFQLNCGYGVEVSKDKLDLVIRAIDTDNSPNNAINRAAYILRKLDELIGLNFECKCEKKFEELNRRLGYDAGCK